ncbi:DUF397 domain-containing protein [Streptomyces chumphonensis]|uniref:DUF397 domain-containing protein n=1 Tax=Streptomyces chumphonensis TaxID=1214925 RepID=UPI003D72C10A
MRDFFWFKASCSAGACVEIAHDWHKSSHSDAGGGDCVEVAACSCATVHVRDSKQTGRGTLSFPSDAWSAFLVDVRRA